MSQKRLMLFDSMYVYEQTFSVVNTKRAPHGSQGSDEHIKSVLRMNKTKLTPDFNVLEKKEKEKKKEYVCIWCWASLSVKCLKSMRPLSQKVCPYMTPLFFK